MVFFSRNTPPTNTVGGVFVSAVIFSTMLAPVVAYPASKSASKSSASHAQDKIPEAPKAYKLNPDFALIDVYKALSNNEFQKAQNKIDELLAEYPNFQLGHLIRGDLIAMRARPITPFSNSASPNGLGKDKLKDLHAEALARMRAITERPKSDQIPSNLIQMAEDQRYALVMDAKRARIYLYENVGGIPSLVSDYYVSQGKFGVDKFKEGDERTPLGVYYITNRLPGAKLPDFYGPGALPLSYPNEWDKLQGRGGSGIWLHGVPSTSYSRPPLASNGCVVFANPDFLKVAATVEVAKTPVIISDQIEFISRSAWQQEKQIARNMVDDWRRNFASANPSNLAQNYSKNFKSANNEVSTTWLQKQLQGVQSSSEENLKLREFSQFKYPGKTDLRVVNFTHDVLSNRGISTVKRRQYWAKEANQWHIIYEESNFVSGSRIEPEIAKVNVKDAVANAKPVPKEIVKVEAVKTTNDKIKDKTSSKTNNATQSDIMKAVDHWANVWGAKNTKAYLAHYAKDFQTPNGESRKSWAEERRSRIEGKGKITIKLEMPSISVDGNTATVKFRQHYQSGALVTSSRKTLSMVKQDGKWLIKQERTGS